ncbi:MAG TPA: TetR/AcrR family transcriptional regulator [Bryobacteraceae bacterium]|nr:TetR/AcrR family transcriptional regulator [Bryobacteraceae bacterium]
MAPNRRQVDSQQKRSAGRPRSELSRVSILETAYSFLQNQPVQSISVVHIAQKAGVSTATVYRWWTTKEALLLDSFLYKTDEELRVRGSAGSPLERLKDYTLRVGRFFSGENGIVAARLITAIQDDEGLRDEFLERIYAPKYKERSSMVREAIQAGEFPSNTNVGMFFDMIFGPLILRLLIRNDQINESFLISVFDRVVAGTKAEDATQNKEVSGRRRLP